MRHNARTRQRTLTILVNEIELFLGLHRYLITTAFILIKADFAPLPSMSAQSRARVGRTSPPVMLLYTAVQSLLAAWCEPSVET